MRLIDADALKEKSIRVSTIKEHCYMRAVGTRVIDNMPTIDAVPVVRCKDCKHYAKLPMLCMHEDGLGTPDKMDFCSYGERRQP